MKRRHYFCFLSRSVGRPSVHSLAGADSSATDAHSVNALQFMRFGVDQARRGWLSADDVINTRSLADLHKLQFFQAA